MLGCSTVCAHALYGRLHMVWFNIPKVLELALNNGVDRMTGETVGPRTGDPRAFRSFDEVADAFKVQLKYALDAVDDDEREQDAVAALPGAQRVSGRPPPATCPSWICAH